MKKIFFTLTVFMLALAANAQEREWNMLKNNKEYICGEGYADTEDAAGKNALEQLLSQISVNVTSHSSMQLNSKNSNGSLDESSQFQQSVQTYSSQTLNNVVRKTFTKSQKYVVGMAIKRSEIEKMFTERAERAKDMVTSALRAESKGHVDDALRNYYWALTLLKSLQNPNSVKHTDNEGIEHVMTNWIKEQIEDIMDSVRFTCVGRDGDDVDLNVTYKGRPVSSAAFTYFDGREWTRPTSVRDGSAKMEFVPGYHKGTYQLKIEYKFQSQAKSDKEVESVLNAVSGSEFPRSSMEIKGIRSNSKSNLDAACPLPTQSAVAESGVSTSALAINTRRPAEMNDKTQYQEIVTAVEHAIRQKNSESVRQYFTADGWDVYTKLIQYGQARLVAPPQYRFYENGDEVTARGLKLSFSFKNGVRKSFVEEVIFTFDGSRKIDNISFGLGKTAEDDIMCRGKWSDKVRLTILNFMENYKTAYALKRYDYIKSIFDDDAIIITGKILKKKAVPGDRLQTSFGGDLVKYNRQTKDQYLKNLKTCFNSQEFINIHFSESEFHKAKREWGDAYGISLEQDYYSETYGDHGYLFLLVDFNNPDTPLIKLRYWQPNKDTDKFGPSGTYKLSDMTRQ